MKKVKSLLSVIPAVVMVFIMALPVRAWDNSGSRSITITTPQPNHKYTSYQVFKGDISKEKKLSNILWGDDIVDGDKILDALKTDKIFGEGEDNALYKAADAAGIADVLEENDSEFVVAFADLVGDSYLKANLEEGHRLNAMVFYTNMVNKSGTILPETGGIGTAIFYIVGGILVVGAAVLLITKKRMKDQ